MTFFFSPSLVGRKRNFISELPCAFMQLSAPFERNQFSCLGAIYRAVFTHKQLSLRVDCCYWVGNVTVLDFRTKKKQNTF